jgi:radical SAM superfamily enzyme YgiQ (UPF0313 family)
LVDRADTLIVSCYELGRQPVAAASAAAFLERAGHRVALLDLAVDSLDGLERIENSRRVRLVAVSVPMHTALHAGIRAVAAIRKALPDAHLCFFGLYATLNSDHLFDGICDSVIGGEFEEPLVELAGALAASRKLDEVRGLRRPGRPARPHLERLLFVAPSRGGLPPLERYARLEIGGESRLAAAVEASRGCLHLCRHCPIPPVYEGRFFVVPRDVVLEDVRGVAAAGARHVTFADADFFNGPGHSMAIVRAMHSEWPELTFDVTTKVENILKHRERLDELAACGCVFVVTAVESLSDEVLDNLRKGHTRDDVFTASGLLRAAGVTMRPSLVSFTPWTRMDDYIEVLEWVAGDDLVHQIDAVQYSIRLLVPPGSMLLELDSLWPHLQGLAPARLSYAWRHPDPRMDRLHGEVSAIVQDAARTDEEADRTFRRVRDAAFTAAGRISPTRTAPARTSAPPPRLTEPWFC